MQGGVRDWYTQTTIWPLPENKNVISHLMFAVNLKLLFMFSLLLFLSEDPFLMSFCFEVIVHFKFLFFLLKMAKTLEQRYIKDLGL